MLKIAVFGFYGPDPSLNLPAERDYLAPVSTADFMRIVWEMEPPATRIGAGTGAPCFAKLTGIAAQPVYVQSLSDRMAPGAALLNCEGYVAIIDALKLLAPRTIESALRRLAEQHPRANLIIAAGRQNEPEALSSDEIREVLGLHPDLPIYPYVPDQPKTVQRLIRRLARYISDPQRSAPPIFAGEERAAPVVSPGPAERSAAAPLPAVPRLHGLAHLSITVSNLARALDFYRGLLGFRLLGHLDWPDDPDGLTITHLDTGRGTLELFSYAHLPTLPAHPDEDNRVGLRHFALRVTDLDAIVEQLECAGVEFTIRPKAIPGGVRIAFLTDPDGTPIELIEGDLIFTRR